METFVLVHGGGTTARFWDRLLDHLDGRALAVDLPGRAAKPADLATITVDDEVASVVADVEAAGIAGPVVLVAHSSGGLVVPGVLRALDGRVSRVVLNAAAVPPEGGSGLDCMQPRHAAGLEAAAADARRTGEPLLTPGPPSDREAFREVYGGPPLDDETLAFVVDPMRCVADTVHHYFQSVSWQSVPEVPVTYISTALDRPIPIGLQREMVARLPIAAKVIELESGHIPAVVDPGPFARMLADDRR